MPLILGTNSIKDTGYDVANSCRFNDGDSPKMQKTIVSGSNTIGTFSCWVKRCTFGADQAIFTSTNDTLWFKIWFHNEDYLRIDRFTGSAWTILKTTSMKFRDPSAWYHIHVALDTTDGTEEDRMVLTVNGTRVTSFASSTNAAEDASLLIGEADYVHRIGANQTSGDFFDGYLAEVVWLDGTASAASNFGEFNEDSPTIWQPINVSGLTFGTNGFYLDFEDSANLGNDANGGTDLTEVNLAATDQATDTPTNNFCTLNPLTNHSNGITLSEGNLKCTTSDSPWQGQSATFGVSAGKWYYEVLATETSVDQYIVAGIQSDYLASSQAGTFGFLYNYSYGMKFYDGDKVYNESDGGTSADHGNAVTDGQIVGVAFDLDNQKMYFSINGTWQNSGDPTSGATGTGSITNLQSGQTYIPNITLGNSGGDPIASVNFGSPSFAISSGNSDADGYGNFEYSVPSGYYSLCTKNLGAYGG